jgi:hypothetical protein|tara:strand:- start:229 stop:516 length:288 start_codon:yes stop_codon:yes gene_type:complete
VTQKEIGPLGYLAYLFHCSNSEINELLCIYYHTNFTTASLMAIGCLHMGKYQARWPLKLHMVKTVFYQMNTKARKAKFENQTAAARCNHTEHRAF